MTKCIVETKIGLLEIAEEEGYIVGISYFDGEKSSFRSDFSPLITDAVKQLNEYFSGERKIFDLPIKYEAMPFCKRVWDTLQKIPYGQTWTYKDIADMLDKPKAYRAVGNACNKNPLLIVVPCHRVVNTNGRLGGFAAGVKIKKSLLDLEKSSLFIK